MDQQHQHASTAFICSNIQSNRCSVNFRWLHLQNSLLNAGPVSLRSALARYADLWAPARKACFPALAASASDEKEAARLRHLASPEGKAEFSDWVGSPRRSLLEVMLAFPSCKPSLGAATTQ